MRTCGWWTRWGCSCEKKRAVFALSQLPANEGVPKLIEVASSHSNPAVRKQAMFWLGQSKDPRALAFFERILFAK